MIVLSCVVPAYGAVAGGADLRPGLISLGEEKIESGAAKIIFPKVAFNYRFALMVQNAGLGEIETLFSEEYQTLRTSLRALFDGGLNISADKKAVEKWYDDNIKKLTDKIASGTAIENLTFEGTAAGAPASPVATGGGKEVAATPRSSAQAAPAVAAGVTPSADVLVRATAPDVSLREATPVPLDHDEAADANTSRETEEDDLPANVSDDGDSDGSKIPASRATAEAAGGVAAAVQGPKITVRLPDDASDDGTLSAESPAGSGPTDDTFADATTETDDLISGNTTDDGITPEPRSPMGSSAGSVTPSGASSAPSADDEEVGAEQAADGTDDDAATVYSEDGRDVPAVVAPVPLAAAAGAGRRVIDLNAPYHVEGQIGRRNERITREHAAMMQAWYADARPTGPIFRFIEKAEEAGRLIVRAKTWRGVDGTAQSKLFQALAESSVYNGGLNEFDTTPEQITRFIVGDFPVDRALDKPRTTKNALEKFRQLIVDYIHSREGAPKSGAPARSAE